MDIQTIRRANLHRIIDAWFGGNRAQFARRAQVDPSYVAQLLTEKSWGRSFGEKAAREIEQRLGLDRGTLDEASAETLLIRHKPSLDEHQGNPGQVGAVSEWHSPEELPRHIWVPVYDYSVSAGDGIVEWAPRSDVEPLPFRPEFFRRLGSRPDQCRALWVRGDSMAPTLVDHDLIMVDTSDQKLRDGEVYALVWDGEALVKRLFRERAGEVILRSDNPDKVRFPDRRITTDELAIVGRVVYRSGLL